MTKELLSSCKYDDDRAGGEPTMLSDSPKLPRDLLCGGSGLPSPGISPNGRESWLFLSGVNCGAVDEKGGDPESGDLLFRRYAELGIPVSLEVRR